MTDNTTETGIRPYGPGKFDLMIDEYVYDLAGTGCDEETGDVQENGVWYGLFRGHFGDSLLSLMRELKAQGYTPEERELIATSVGAIISENDQGFVSVDYYTDKAKLETDWAECLSETSDDDPEDDGPQEDDIQTEDHRTFYESGRLILEPYNRHDDDPQFWAMYLKGHQFCFEAPDYKAALRHYMERSQWWPNVWFISDHGNAILLDISEGK